MDLLNMLLLSDISPALDEGLLYAHFPNVFFEIFYPALALMFIYCRYKNKSNLINSIDTTQ
jgi:hypothetical protein